MSNKYRKYNFDNIIQLSEVIGSYLYKYQSDINVNCILNIIDKILLLNNKYFTHKLCESNTVLLLSQLINNWINYYITCFNKYKRY